MKVLIVAEQPDIMDYLQNLSVDSGVFLVQYTHPIKAMDNLEEIAPDAIIWSADDFPRHWKICFPFCQAIPSLSKCQFYLVSENQLDDEESGKAEALGVKNCYSEGFFNEHIADIWNAEISKPPRIPLLTTPQLPEGEGSLVLMHPTLKRMVMGSLIQSGNGILLAAFRNEELGKSFVPQLIIDNARARIGNTMQELLLKVLSRNESGTVTFLIIQAI